MTMRTPLAAPLAVAAFLALTLGALAPARASLPTDCPPGSVGKEEGTFAWCEPTVCRTDADCMGGDRVCRSLPLCLQVGALDPDASLKGGASPDAAKRLVATGRCAPSEPRCPSDSTCSDMMRCLSRADAQRMGVPEPAAPKPSASAAPVSETGKPPPRCGCDVPGARTSAGGAGLLLAALGLVAAGRRRRR
jgi:MYXO-CTERM domain-containing protein